jgi:phage shock protein B
VEDGVAVFAILLGTSLVVFVLFVMPIWVWLHYKDRARNRQPAVVPVPAATFDAGELNALADRMEKRVSALESIMDAEAPGWRSKS